MGRDVLQDILVLRNLVLAIHGLGVLAPCRVLRNLFCARVVHLVVDALAVQDLRSQVASLNNALGLQTALLGRFPKA